jgi:integrase
MAKKLTVRGVAALKVKGGSEARKHSFERDPETPGLAVQVSFRQKDGVLDKAHGVTRSWVFIYTSPTVRKADGKRAVRHMGLGPCDVISLAEARALAKAARRLVVLGADPIEHRIATLTAERDAQLREKASRMTFRDCAEGLLATQLKKFKNDKHKAQWRSTLGLANRAFGDLPVQEIDEAKLLKLLHPLWNKTPETASRLRGRIEKVLAWATPQFRQGENPARWDNNLDVKLGTRPKAKHHEAMPYADLPAFMARLRERESMSARALEFLILTATRTGEIIGAKWDEIDLGAKTWTIPAERMKARQAHVVPLSDRAVALLGALPRIGAYIFPGAVEGKPLSNMAMRELLKGMDANGYTCHGFRSSFRDWAGDNTNFEHETAEFALAHGVPNKTTAAYRRYTSLEKRKLLMQQWANYCAGAQETGDNVVSMKGRG